MDSAISLRKQIIWLLVIKLAALMVIYALFFSPTHRIHIDAQRIESQLLD